MKRTILTIIVLASFSMLALAQDEDTTTTRKPRSSRFGDHFAKVGGAGGFIPGWAVFDVDGINKVLKNANMPQVNANPMYLSGGIGYGYIMFLRNVRFGGMGMGGTITSSVLDASSNVRKDVEYRVQYGGFLADYVVPVAEDLDVSVGMTIGGGSVSIVMRRDDNSFKQWDNLWSEFGTNGSTKNLTRRLDGSFFVFNPNVNLEYAILRWFQIRAGIGFPIFSNPGWKLDEKYDILGVPGAIKVSGYAITGGIMFGFFN